MSLVNDMLRDLDARRRDAPTRGIRTEKLVPAQEHSAKSQSRGLFARRAMIVVMVLLAGAAGMAATVYMMNGGEQPSQQSPLLVETAPLVEENPAASESSQQEMLALAQRLEELERQNRALRATTQSGAASQTDQQAQTSPSTQVSDDLLPDLRAEVTSAREWQARDWSQTQQPTLSPPARSQPAETAAPAPIQSQPQSQSQSGLPSQQAQFSEPPPNIRMPREMGFRDRDRLQVQQALALWSAGQFNEALHALDVFTMENPEAHQSRETLAKLLIQRGELVTALQAAEIGLAISPNHSGYKKIKARVLMSQSQAGEALGLLNDRPPGVRVDPEYHDLMATAALAVGDYATARGTYEQLLEQDEEQGRWWFGLATSLEALGRNNQATQAYERALRSSDLSAALRLDSQQRLTGLRQ